MRKERSQRVWAARFGYLPEMTARMCGYFALKARLDRAGCFTSSSPLMGGHWLLAREVSAARQSIIDRRAEEDREEKRREAEAQRQIQLKEAESQLLERQTAAIHAERRRLAQLPPEQRRSVLAASPTPKLEPFVPVAKEAAVVEVAIEPAITSSTSAPATLWLTPDQVTEKWWWYLTALAFAECFASILAGAAA